MKKKTTYDDDLLVVSLATVSIDPTPEIAKSDRWPRKTEQSLHEVSGGDFPCSFQSFQNVQDQVLFQKFQVTGR